MVMKGEQVALVAAFGAGIGATTHSVGINTGNRVVDAAIGIGLAVAGWYIDHDGVGDFVEGFGVGYFLASVL